MKYTLRKFRRSLHSRRGVMAVLAFALFAETLSVTVATESIRASIGISLFRPTSISRHQGVTARRRLRMRREALARLALAQKLAEAEAQTPSISLHPSAEEKAAPVLQLRLLPASVLQEVPSAESSPPVPAVIPSHSSASASSSPAPVLVAPAPVLVPINSSASASSSLQGQGEFPAFERTVFPVSKVPHWGAMHTPAEWNRDYEALHEEDFVSVPAYNLSSLQQPLLSLLNLPSQQREAALTAKLFYSTRYYGAYNLDAGEFTGPHPGVDLKLALGTPIGAIGGGEVRSVSADSRLGLHVIIEHRMPGRGTFYSIYAHLGQATVREGQAVHPGQHIGFVGMTGSTTAPHLHLQIDRGQAGEMHVPYAPASVPSREEAARRTVHAIRFIETGGQEG